MMWTRVGTLLAEEDIQISREWLNVMLQLWKVCRGDLGQWLHFEGNKKSLDYILSSGISYM